MWNAAAALFKHAGDAMSEFPDVAHAFMVYLQESLAFELAALLSQLLLVAMLADLMGTCLMLFSSKYKFM